MRPAHGSHKSRRPFICLCLWAAQLSLQRWKDGECMTSDACGAAGVPLRVVWRGWCGPGVVGFGLWLGRAFTAGYLLLYGHAGGPGTGAGPPPLSRGRPGPPRRGCVCFGGLVCVDLHVWKGVDVCLFQCAFVGVYWDAGVCVH